MSDINRLLSKLPKVDSLLQEDRILKIEDVSRTIVVEAIRETINEYRQRILNKNIDSFNNETIIEDILKEVRLKNRLHLRKVINATGTVFHTNLGRAVLAKKALDAVVDIASNYNNLEFDLDEGKRGSRYSHVEELICKLTGAEAALVVNNNAAAVMLALSSLCKNKEAIVSRGQLVEIGGSFRIPSVMEQSGAKLHEVGTTNRSHLYDYENAINENTGVILKVHQSNYKIVGFTEELEIEDFVMIGEKYSIPVIEDIGSGVLIDMSKYNLTYEPTVQESISKGIDVVTFSGDKLLGGPQAGIIVGKKKYIDLMKKNQLNRALRIDKMTLAALEATLKLYIDEERAINEIPGLNMLVKKTEEIKKDAQRISKALKARVKDRAEINIEEDFSQVGGGAMPLERINTYVISIKPFNKKTEEVEVYLRNNEIPIITRIYKDKIIIDPRTLFKGEIKIVVDTLCKIL